MRIKELFPKALLASAAISASFALIPEASARYNPGGCKNANAAAHNPNCHGGSSTHIAIQTPPTQTNVQTVVVTPKVVTPNKPQVITGYSPYYVPKPIPQQVPVATPNPTPQATPSAVPNLVPNQIVRPIPQKTMTGYSPYYVPTPTPQLAPVATPNPTPQATPSAVPNLVPNQVVRPIPQQTVTGYSPYYVPTPTPQQVPVATPNPTPLATPSAVPNLAPNQIVKPKPQQTVSGYSPYYVPNKNSTQPNGGGNGKTTGGGVILIHAQYGAPLTDGKSFVPPKPGKNFIEGYRAVHIDDNGLENTCMLSGLGRREINNQTGAKWLTGHAETLHFRSASTAHLPSNQRHNSNHCIVSVRKRVPL